RQRWSLAENSGACTAVGSIVASEPTTQRASGSPVSGNSGNAFAINANTGAITVVNSAALDYETTPAFQLTVQVTDKGSPQLSARSEERRVVTDVNEPARVASEEFAVAENRDAGRAVG